MRYVSLALLAGLAVTPALAQSGSPFAGDTRLDRPITVHWKKATLVDALQEVSKATGVELAPSRGQVDEPVMLSATQVPARRVLEQVGTLLHFTWATNGGPSNAPKYLLFQGRNAQIEEEREIEGAKRAVLQALEKELDRYRQFSRMPEAQARQELEKADQEMSKLFEGGIATAAADPKMGRRMMDSMTLRSATTPSGRALLGLLDGLSQPQWQQLLNEESDPIVYSSSPGPGELPLPGGVVSALRSESPTFPLPKSLFRSMGPQVEQGISQVEKMMSEHWGKADGFKVTLEMSLNMGQQPMGMLRVTPQPTGAPSEIAPIFSLAGMNLIGAPTMFEEPAEDPAVREQRLAADPVLGRKITLKLPPLKPQDGFMAILGSSYRIADVLPAFEAASGLRVISDAYNKQAMAVIPPPAPETPVYKLLDQMGGMVRRWERDGDFIRFRSKTWAFDRRAEIPVRYMQKWLADRDKRGGLGLDGMAQIAGLLRDEQVDSLMFSAMEAGATQFTDFMMISMNKEILRFWDKLLPAQRARARSGQPLAVASLFPYQQATLVGMARKQKQSMFSMGMAGGKPARRPDQLAQARFSMELTPTGPAAGAPVQPGTPPGVPPAQPNRQPRTPAGAAFGQQMAATIGVSTGVCKMTLQFPDGQKDEFIIPLFAPSAETPKAPEPPKAEAEPPRAVPAPAPVPPPVRAPGGL